MNLCVLSFVNHWYLLHSILSIFRLRKTCVSVFTIFGSILFCFVLYCATVLEIYNYRSSTHGCRRGISTLHEKRRYGYYCVEHSSACLTHPFSGCRNLVPTPTHTTSGETLTCESGSLPKWPVV